MTVPAPSDEAVEAAQQQLEIAGKHWLARALTAAYAVDLPRREAEVRAEERAATLREVEALYDALAFYATKSNWTARVGGAPAWHDHGELARKALAAPTSTRRPRRPMSEVTNTSTRLREALDGLTEALEHVDVVGEAGAVEEFIGAAYEAREALAAASEPREEHVGALWQNWPSASCCGEPRVCRDVDACYDCARPCAACGEPSEAGLCPTHGPAPEPEWEYRAVNSHRGGRVAHGTEQKIRALAGMFPALHIERRVKAGPWERTESHEEER